MKFWEIMTCSKLQVPKRKITLNGYQVKKKVPFQKLMQLALTLVPFHYIRNPDIFIIRGIFKNLEYSKCRRYLDPCQTLHWKIVPGYNYFCRMLLLRLFQIFSTIRFWHNATQLVQLFQVLLQTYSDIFEHCSRAYSRILRTLCIPGIFGILAYSYHKPYSESKAYS